MLKEEIAQRALPPLLIMNDGTAVTRELWPQRRAEILDILQRHLYGYTPQPPAQVSGEIVEQGRINAFAGKVNQQQIRISFDTPNGPFSFPLHLFLPRNNSRVPLFLYINFRSAIPDIYCPVEEITDHGFGIAMICYKDIVNDNLSGDYSDGLGKLYIDQRERHPDEWGKIGMWAYATSRVMDYLQTREEINHQQIAVAGHSRLGKTALWCAAQDERFMMAISNDSGIFGAAIAKHSTGERISDFLRCGSWDWFCENLKPYSGREDNDMPFDQHMLLAAIAPRYICVGSAELDKGADPKSEFSSCVAASEVYKLLGLNGIITPDEYPKVGTNLHEGEIGYHIRSGRHYHSRADWHQYMAFMEAKIHQE